MELEDVLRVPLVHSALRDQDLVVVAQVANTQVLVLLLALTASLERTMLTRNKVHVQVVL